VIRGLKVYTLKMEQTYWANEGSKIAKTCAAHVATRRRKNEKTADKYKQGKYMKSSSMEERC
jgi:hypothetical protein